MKILREQYRELSGGKPVPYLFEIVKNKQILFYFGANHSRDPKNKQYPILKKYWKRFLIARSSPKIAVVESGLRKLARNDRVAIQSGSEGSLVTLLASRANIPVICPEAPRRKIISLLRKKFPEDTVQYEDFAGLIDSWRRYNPKPNFTEWMTEVMAIQSKRLGFKGFTLPRLKKIHRRLFKKDFNNRNSKFFNTIINPNVSGTIVNKVARASGDIRDVQIIKGLKKEWLAGKSLFVVYGCGHAFLHEPILKNLFK